MSFNFLFLYILSSPSFVFEIYLQGNIYTSDTKIIENYTGVNINK